ncbi:MAG TPA: methyltransferase domain-containing protein [Patescibacteria group bacterium]|nr:methyltransferase domain-containing protein [Patescibacteria group bacterium]
MQKKFGQKTSWQKVAPWYNKITGDSGHYYHEHLVIPGVIRLLNLKPESKLLDLACGNGVLGRAINKNVAYTGVDVAPSLISEAKRMDRNPNHEYLVSDITKPLNLPNDFTNAAIVLSLQNVADPLLAIKNASDHLKSGSSLVIALNHPAFRIPRQSSWEIDEGKKTQFRRIDRYMTPLEIPINMNPGDRTSKLTLSYHFPISAYSRMLKDAGFTIDLIEEWTSDKESVGSAGRMENRARNEFPLFMAIRATKL